MVQKDSKSIENFNNEIAIKFQLYNSLFLSLPFYKIEKTGILLSLLLSQCEEGYAKGKNVIDIINSFFDTQTKFTNEKDKIDLLFRFIQYIERQVVLFDALEDAAYGKTNKLNGPGTLKQLETTLSGYELKDSDKIKLETFAVRLVLTAHPTQFYPGPVLGIINDLGQALKSNDTTLINILLQQLGKTPFLKNQKPTPYDEAISLIWFLENVFYQSIGQIIADYGQNLPFINSPTNPIIKMGFWPGGDRDGNPFVRAETTFRVAEALNLSLLKCYYKDVRKLRRRLTFRKVEEIIIKIEAELYNQAFLRSTNNILQPSDLINPLNQVKDIIINEHDGMFVEKVDSLISKIYCFGLHFAFIDIRQENEMHEGLINEIILKNDLTLDTYNNLTEKDKIAYILSEKLALPQSGFVDPIYADTIDTIRTVKKIQQQFGEAACHRYIISQCSSALNVFEVLALFKASGWRENEISVDIVPLFETIDDLIAAPEIMKSLYESSPYMEHLNRRKNKQTIMLGFSDGTKDGGYLMANWMIYKAKEELSKVASKHNIDVLFFDGRGGPPARGGGKTHKFYASMDKDISSKEIQLTIQGQTISANFGIKESAKFNLEQLINAGVTNNILADKKSNFTEREEKLIFSIAENSLVEYRRLKNHENFVQYMAEVTPLKYFGMTNIGSRPSKRGKSSKLSIKDLRAIPFVGSWTMIKQNVPGFYGLGSALENVYIDGKFDELKDIYQKSLFFRTLIDNSEMSLYKTFFPLTSHLEGHPIYGDVRNMILNEYNLATKYLLMLGDHDTLMQNYPVETLSIQMRERITLPLVSIQQYALHKIAELKDSEVTETKSAYEKMVIRCAFGIINAGRNSA